MADCGKGRKRPGSLRCPLFTLRLMPAAQWPQEIGSWAGNRAGNRQQQSRPRLYLGPLPLLLGQGSGPTGRGEVAGGQVPLGNPCCFRADPTSRTDPFCHYDSISVLEATEGPCQASSRVPPHSPAEPLLCPVPEEPNCHSGDQSTGAGCFPILTPLLSPQGLCTAVACLECSTGLLRPHACGEASRGPPLHPCDLLASRLFVSCWKAGAPVMPDPGLQCLELTVLVPGSAR